MFSWLAVTLLKAVLAIEVVVTREMVSNPGPGANWEKSAPLKEMDPGSFNAIARAVCERLSVAVAYTVVLARPLTLYVTMNGMTDTEWYSDGWERTSRDILGLNKGSELTDE
jgi:hypothetical protein